MNPASNETAGLQVPLPEQLPAAKAAKEAASSGPAPAELAAAAEKAPSAPRGAQAAPMPPMTLPLPPAGPQSAPLDDNSTIAQIPPSSVADDGDLIEKEWVNKAKQIVEANRNDPYKQSEELTVFRADYMKKRYGKNIKLSK